MTMTIMMMMNDDAQLQELRQDKEEAEMGRASKLEEIRSIMRTELTALEQQVLSSFPSPSLSSPF